LDALKGYAACTWLVSLMLKFFTVAPEHVGTLQIIAGIAAVLGHNYTCWLKFKGGKGIATSAGVFLALAPWALLIALVVFILAVASQDMFPLVQLRRVWHCRWRFWIMIHIIYFSAL